MKKKLDLGLREPLHLDLEIHQKWEKEVLPLFFLLRRKNKDAKKTKKKDAKEKNRKKNKDAKSKHKNNDADKKKNQVNPSAQ